MTAPQRVPDAPPRKPPNMTQIAYSEAVATTRDGKTFKWGRCAYNYEATPSDNIVVLTAMDDTHGRQPGDMVVIPFSNLAALTLTPSRLAPSGLVS